jgi:hypothetical protein
LKLFSKKIQDDMRYSNAGMQPYMEAKYVNIAFLLILNTGAIRDACRDWKRRTPVNKTWADFRREFARSQRKKALSQAQKAVQGITLHVLQNTMDPNPFLMAGVLSLPWPTWPLPLLLTV